MKNILRCALCKNLCKNEDSVIPVTCQVPVAFPLSLLYTTRAVTDYFHEGCLKSYYSTQTRGYDIVHKEVVYYSPVHLKIKVVLPTKIVAGINLPDKRNMTDEDLVECVRQLDEGKEKIRYDASTMTCSIQ